MISKETLRELEDTYGVAADYADAHRDAVKKQAEKHGLDKAALARFVRARYSDKLAKLAEEQETYHQLTMHFMDDRSVVTTTDNAFENADGITLINAPASMGKR